MIYCVSDIHGHFDLFKKMLDDINFSDQDTLYILGDVIDRGNNCVDIIRYIIKHPNIKLLVGNHELMMFAHQNQIEEYDFWLYGNNGGQTTKEQFSKLSKEEKRVFDACLFRLSALQIEIKLNKTYLLSHSAFVSKEGTIDRWWLDVPLSTVEYVTWYSPFRRDTFINSRNYQKDGRVHIIGHVPVQCLQEELAPYIQGNIINIDGGCAYKNSKEMDCGLICFNLTAFDNGEDKFYKVYR